MESAQCLKNAGFPHTLSIHPSYYSYSLSIITLFLRAFPVGSLWLGPASHQVSPSSGRLTEKRRPWPSWGPGAHESSERLQHSEDRHRRHASVHGPDRRSLSLIGRPQKERPGLWDACEAVHSRLEVTGWGQFCAQGTDTPHASCCSLSNFDYIWKRIKVYCECKFDTKSCLLKENIMTCCLKNTGRVPKCFFWQKLQLQCFHFKFIVILSKSYLPHVIMLCWEMHISVKQVCSIWMNWANIAISQWLAAMRVQVPKLMTWF